MEIAVISDLHLGQRDEADSFEHDDARFESFLRFLERNFERIVLLGDIWETLTPRIPGDYEGELRRAKEAHPRIARRFEGAKYWYVHGNHDWVAGKVDGAPDELTIDRGGLRVLFTHGHDHDAFVGHPRWLSEAGVWLGGWLKRFGLSHVYRLFERMEAMQSQRVGPGSLEDWASHLGVQRRADVVVTGHSHVPKRTDFPGVTFVNSGTCSGGRLEFAALDLGRGRFDVHQSLVA
ncbi:MAG: metallophosphoesterase family protein [Polyangiaceae bacterium]